MQVVYERTGGFIGLNQRMELMLEPGGVKVEAREVSDSRPLEGEEVARLRALLEALPAGQGPRQDAQVADGFQLGITLETAEGARTARFQTIAVPIPQSEAPGSETESGPWIALLRALDGLLEAELTRLAPGRNRVRGVDGLAE